MLVVGIALGDCALAQTHAPLMVTARVAPVANLELISQPAMISVSALDVERGFLDVAIPSSMRIRSNSPRGYELEFTPVLPLFSALAVRGLSQQDVTIGAAGGSVVQRWQHGQAVALNLSWRFYLAPGVTAGEYAWPLRLDVRPLSVGQ